LLDEPAQGLDAPLRSELYAVLHQVREEFKTPTLLVTHDVDECFELGEEMVVLAEGHIVQRGSPRKVFEKPANAAVARLLGNFNLMQAEIRTLDPGRNLSRVLVGEYELEGPYFPGKLLGDRVTLCLRPEHLIVMAANGRPAANYIPADLTRTIEKPHGMRLEFTALGTSILVDLSHAEFQRHRETKAWLIGFPRESVRAL